MKGEYHIQHFGPCEPHWPRGGWSLYQITGDQIAERTVRANVVHAHGGAYYTGDVVARHAWCGYAGIYETLPEVMAAIAAIEEAGGLGQWRVANERALRAARERT